ncbi:MAG: hypothetical protein EHM48_06545 [Planctomycetaceae bacterium]|nr:MAG: hypothetical protein EHM48_06545 [Planctomycetaceae bacterium]
MMLALSAETGLLIMWVVFSALALLAVIAVFVWAIRTRQFRNQDRARYLALDSKIEDDQTPAPPDSPASGEKKESTDVPA